MNSSPVGVCIQQCCVPWLMVSPATLVQTARVSQNVIPLVLNELVAA